MTQIWYLAISGLVLLNSSCGIFRKKKKNPHELSKAEIRDRKAELYSRSLRRLDDVSVCRLVVKPKRLGRVRLEMYVYGNPHRSFIDKTEFSGTAWAKEVSVDLDQEKHTFLGTTESIYGRTSSCMITFKSNINSIIEGPYCRLRPSKKGIKIIASEDSNKIFLNHRKVENYTVVSREDLGNKKVVIGQVFNRFGVSGCRQEI